MNIRRVILLALFALGGCAGTETFAGTLSIKDVEWEPACGGSNIQVTRVDGKIVAVDAFAEHYSEGREWHCHYVEGRVSSVLYKHYKAVRKMLEDGQFTVEPHYDVVTVYPIKDHKLDSIPGKLRDDLIEVITKAQKESVASEGRKP